MLLRQLSIHKGLLRSSNQLRTCCVSWGFRDISTDTATGVNYFKKGEDPPLKDDSEYPDWLWRIADTPPTLSRLQKQLGDNEVDSSNERLVKRMVKLQNTKNIKDENFLKGKN